MKPLVRKMVPLLLAFLLGMAAKNRMGPPASDPQLPGRSFCLLPGLSRSIETSQPSLSHKVNFKRQLTLVPTRYGRLIIISVVTAVLFGAFLAISTSFPSLLNCPMARTVIRFPSTVTNRK